jgi:hypothetical protein
MRLGEISIVASPGRICWLASAQRESSWLPLPASWREGQIRFSAAITPSVAPDHPIKTVKMGASAQDSSHGTAERAFHRSCDKPAIERAVHRSCYISSAMVVVTSR